MCLHHLVQLACWGSLPGLHLSRQALTKLVQGSAGPRLGALLERDSCPQPSTHIMADPACAVHCTAERCRPVPRHAGPFTPSQCRGPAGGVHMAMSAGNLQAGLQISSLAPDEGSPALGVLQPVLQLGLGLLPSFLVQLALEQVQRLGPCRHLLHKRALVRPTTHGQLTTLNFQALDPTP